MAQHIGVFDETALPSGWFDASLRPIGWFSTDLTDPVGAGQSVVYFNIDSRALLVTRQAQGVLRTMPVLSRAFVVVRNAVQPKLVLQQGSKSISISRGALRTLQTFGISSKAIQISKHGIGMVMLYPPVLFEIAQYVWGVQGAPIQMGSVGAVQGLVIPRAILQAWLWQNQEEVLLSRGTVNILRSGTVIFVVG